MEERYHVTTISKCPTAFAIEVSNFKRLGKRKNNLKNVNGAQALYQAVAWANPFKKINIEHNISLTINKQRTIYGRVDVFVADDKVVIEVKSAKELPDTPLIWDVLQLNMYLAWSALKYGQTTGYLHYVVHPKKISDEEFVKILSRDLHTKYYPTVVGSEYVKSFKIKFDPILFNMTLRMIEDVERFVAEGKIPLMKKNAMCAFCEFRGLCPNFSEKKGDNYVEAPEYFYTFVGGYETVVEFPTFSPASALVR